MVLKVNHDDLEDFALVMKKDSEAYNTEIDKLLGDIETLRTIWQGVDAETFCTNVSNYIKKMKGITSALSTMSELTTKSNNGYNERDEAFGKALEKEAKENER